MVPSLPLLSCESSVSVEENADGKKMYTYFSTKTDVAKNLMDDFFSNFECERTFP